MIPLILFFLRVKNIHIHKKKEWSIEKHKLPESHSANFELLTYLSSISISDIPYCTIGDYKSPDFMDDLSRICEDIPRVEPEKSS